MPSICKDEIRRLCHSVGACATGFAAVAPVPNTTRGLYERWIAESRNSSMEYMEKYVDIRNNPAQLLDGAKTLICCAFAYATNGTTRHPLFADYALGRDYHEVLRQRLETVCRRLEDAVPGSVTRICVDTAPLRERFWASRAGVGFIGLNNQLIVPGIGSRVFLAEILWSGEVTPDESLEYERCCGCRACVVSCPMKALDGDGGIDCRRCLSYLTIEHHGDFSSTLKLPGRIYGCDICQDVCPYNRNARKTDVIEEFQPTEELQGIDIESILAMSQSDFSRLFSHSAVRRAKLAGLLRNAHHHTTDGYLED